jgi:hypothetical protein
LLSRCAAAGDDAIATLERIGRHADRNELESIIQLEPPRLCLSASVGDINEDERMWVYELKLRHDAFDRQLLAPVVDAGDRMMGLDLDSSDRKSESQAQEGSHTERQR